MVRLAEAAAVLSQNHMEKKNQKKPEKVLQIQKKISIRYP